MMYSMYVERSKDEVRRPFCHKYVENVIGIFFGNFAETEDSTKQYKKMAIDIDSYPV